MIRLRCTRDELVTLEPFVETEYVQREISYMDPVVSAARVRPYIVKETVAVPVEHERIPPGELAVRRGAEVKATDGRVGLVESCGLWRWSIR